MLSTNSPPVADAHGIAVAAAGTNLEVDTLVDGGEEEFAENYELMTEGNDGKYSLSEQMVHFCGGHITRVHWTSCKAVIAFYAGSSVSKLSQMTKKLREASCLRIYFNAVDELDEEHFCAEAKSFFRDSLSKTNEPLLGTSLYRYFLDSRCKIRNHMLPLFPRDLVKMKSEHGFHDTCNKVCVNAYWQEMASLKRKGTLKYTRQEVAQMLPPPNWEYMKAPWYFGLVIKVFRRDPQLALDVADVMSDVTNAPLSRAELKRQRQKEALEGNSKKKSSTNASTTSSSDSPSLCSPGDGGGNEPWYAGESYPGVVSSSSNNFDTRSVMSMATDNQEKFASAKMLASKAAARTYNVGVRLAVLEELEKGMNLLEKIRGTI